MPFTILPLLACCSVSVMQPNLTVEAGQSILFRLQGDGIEVIGPGDLPGPGELRVKLTVEGGQTMLHITNNSPQWLNYRAKIRQSGGKERRTSVCTLMSGNRSAFESWPGRIESVTIYAFKPAPEGSITCG